MLIYHAPRPVDGELGFELYSQVKATSAASSLALFRFLPSYQNRALWTAPCTVTRLDHAVRPPGHDGRSMSVLCFRQRKE